VLISMVLSISTAEATPCQVPVDWMNRATATQAVWNVSANEHERRFMASQLDGLDGSFECDAFGNLCDVMTPSQAENAVEDVVTKAAQGWTKAQLRSRLASLINAANPNGFANPGFTQIGHNIAVGWGGASGPLTPPSSSPCSVVLPVTAQAMV
jgi:hypothetical protein